MINRLILLLLPILLSACVGMPKYVPLDQKTKSDLGEVRVLAVIPQDEIVVVAANPGVSVVLGGGLLGALIDSQIAKNRQNEIQKVIEPFYASIDDVDYRKLMSEEFTPHLRTAFEGKIAEVTFTPLFLTQREREQQVAALAPGKSLMYVSVIYFFSHNLTHFNAIMSVNLWTGGKPEPVYSNKFNYRSAQLADRTAPMQAWADAGGKLYRSAVTESISEIANMLLADLKYPRIEGVDRGLPDPAPSTSAQTTPSAQAFNIPGPVLATKGSRMIVRETDGSLFSFTR
jgi:hypothetical protein